jgi:hypothetical protein
MCDCGYQKACFCVSPLSPCCVGCRLQMAYRNSILCNKSLPYMNACIGLYACLHVSILQVTYYNKILIHQTLPYMNACIGLHACLYMFMLQITYCNEIRNEPLHAKHHRGQPCMYGMFWVCACICSRRVDIYIYTHTHIYIYIHMCIYTHNNLHQSVAHMR